MLGRAADPALARRALDLSLTTEPGPTISAGIIRAVAERHPAMALDFVLANLPRVNQLVDLSGRSRFVGRLVEQSGDLALIPKLQAYAAANLGADDRRPVGASGWTNALEGRKPPAHPSGSHRLATQPLSASSPLRASAA